MKEIWIEKFESEPGIYAIFNISDNVNYNNKKKIYIGKSKNLKLRMTQHVDDLFKNKDNKNLQSDFNLDNVIFRISLLHSIDKDSEVTSELNKYESLYYLAAADYLGEENLYNEIELKSQEELYNGNPDTYIQVIKNILDNLNEKKGVMCINENKIQDWIGVSQNEIKSRVVGLLNDLNGNKSINENQISINEVSLKKLYDNNELDFMLLGKMGDYVGRDDQTDIQTFTDILVEKIADINYYGKCLWATSGPNIQEFNKYRNILNKEKKVYVLFYLTFSEYKSKSKTKGYYYWNECENNKLYCVAPKGKKKFKALVIKDIMLVKELFLIEYLKVIYTKAILKSTDYRNGEVKKMLPSSLKEDLQNSLLNVFSNKCICNNEEVQSELIWENLLDEFKSENNNFEFPTFTESNGSTYYYVLAEVEKYVEIQECDETSNKTSEEEKVYRYNHPHIPRK